METKPHNLSPPQLLLDPNNYRFHDLPQYKRVANRARYAEEGVQNKALELLSTTDAFDLDGLKDSILTNGYVPIEQIVAVEYADTEERKRYLIVEGNRRVAAVKILLSDTAGAVDISEAYLHTLQHLPVIEVIGSEDERKDYQRTLMAIRHVAGIKEWGHINKPA